MLVDMAIEGTEELNYNKFMLCYEASVLMFWKKWSIFFNINK